MKAKIKAKWLEALRSGEYVQGKNALKTKEGKYCCLGVLCDLHRKTTKKAGCNWGVNNSGEGVYFKNTGALPKEVMDWAGFTEHSADGDLVLNGKGTNLASLNDGKGYGFKRIAQVIEKHF